jgi:fucose 4-O-acetylase-like acetyltransferase
VACVSTNLKLLFTRNKQLSDYLLLLIPYFVFWHIRTIVVSFKNKIKNTVIQKHLRFLNLPFFYLLLLLLSILISEMRFWIKESLVPFKCLKRLFISKTCWKAIPQSTDIVISKNKEPEQKHAKLIYCILFTWKRNKQLSDYLLLLIPYFVFWHIRTIVVPFNKKFIHNSGVCVN